MIDQRFPVAGPIALDCRLSSGSVAVQAVAEATEVRVRISPEGASRAPEDRFRVELSDGTLTVHDLRERNGARLDGLFNWNGHDSYRVQLEVPAGSALRAAVHSADLTTTGRLANTDLACGSAAVELDQIEGELRVRTGSGGVSVNRVTGSANFRGGSGDLRIGEATADVTVGVGSGSLHLGTAHGPLRLRSGSGDAIVAAVMADVEVTSGSGAVSIGLPAGQPARLDVMTGSGRLRTEMPVEDSPATSAPSITLRARTGSGDITVHRASLHVHS
jgi:hypothetical protein